MLTTLNARTGATCVALLAWLHLSGGDAHATNVYFMPGDAFFHTRLTEDAVSSLAGEAGTATLAYERPSPFSFCGYAGFPSMQIQDMDPGTVRSFKELYADLRRQYPKQIQIMTTTTDTGIDVVTQEINGFHLLVYSSDFDVQRFRLALKYNEDWHSPPIAAVGTRGWLIMPARSYDPFVKTHEAVVEDWRNAGNVPGLPVEVPKDLLWARSGPQIEAPVRARAQELRFLVFPADSLGWHFKRKNNEEFWEVTPSGIKAYSWKRGELIAGDWEGAAEGSTYATEGRTEEFP
jgi:hypothetical protein